MNPLLKLADIIANDLTESWHVSKAFQQHLDDAIKFREQQSSKHIPQGDFEEQYRRDFIAHIHIVDILKLVRDKINEGMQRHRKKSDGRRRQDQSAQDAERGASLRRAACHWAQPVQFTNLSKISEDAEERFPDAGLTDGRMPWPG